MDSRIEELAAIIIERCDSVRDSGRTIPSVQDGSQADKYRTYRMIGELALQILFEVRDYRDRHPDLYD